MPELHQLLMFIAAGWLLNLTPGPDVLYIVSNALRSGTRAGIVAGLGITAGCFVHIFAAAVGVGALLATSATVARSVVTSTAGGNASDFVFEGPWALFRLFDRVRIEPGAAPDRAQFVLDVEGRTARFEVRSATPLNPLMRQELEQFQCPKRL